MTSPLSPSAPLIESLKQVAVLLKRDGVPFALSGGFAVFARGGPPSTHDVDFAVREVDAERARSVLTAAGMHAETCPEDWLVKVYDGDVLVDLIFRIGGRPVDDAVLGRADDLEVGSVRMPVLDATDLTVGKLRAFSAHNVDFSPALLLVRALREQIDWAAVRAETEDSPYAVAFLVLCSLLGITTDPGPEETTTCRTPMFTALPDSNGSSRRTPTPPSSASA